MARKTLVGYCDPLSVAPGETVAFKVSCYAPGPYRADIVRLVCGDTSSRGAGFQEHEIDTPVSGEYAGREQPVHAGSYAVVPSLPALGSFSVSCVIWPTAPTRGRQVLVGTHAPQEERGFALEIDEHGAPALLLAGGTPTPLVVSTDLPLRAREWCRLAASFDADTGDVVLAQDPLPAGPGSAAVARRALVRKRLRADAHAPAAGPLLFAARRVRGDAASLVTGDHYCGKLDSVRLVGLATERPASCDDADLLGCWDFSRDLSSLAIRDVGPLGLDGWLVNLPRRGVTGCGWNGTAQSWHAAPQQYSAIHFHDDDLYDAGWQTDFSFTVPGDLPSGVYAARLRQGEADDYIPFFVRPGPDQPRAEVVYLAATASYLAYANQRLHLSGVLGNTGEAPSDNDELMLEHPEFGPSLYEHHRDGSGVHHSSRLRPILNLKAKHQLWQFNADSNVTAWLEHTGRRYDVVTDEDLHREGEALLRPYRVLITGTHPEYWSTDMLDGLEGYLARGGRMMYLGGNGFYWRVAFHAELPGVIEVRRAEDGTRAWISEPGEYYQAFNGEYGGLWRRLGRPPNRVAGVGFAAQGFDGSSHYRRREASRDPRAAWIFEGVSAKDDFGDYGRVGGGAAGEEIDRCDTRLGSPPHALILASSVDHKPGMLRTKEEFFATFPPFRDPNVRADLTFFEGPNGGAVFSTGSIAWCGSLAHDGYHNDVARITTNVLERFVSTHPFSPPAD